MDLNALACFDTAQMDDMILEDLGGLDTPMNFGFVKDKAPKFPEERPRKSSFNSPKLQNPGKKVLKSKPSVRF